jgi:hypothetical protein
MRFNPPGVSRRSFSRRRPALAEAPPSGFAAGINYGNLNAVLADK